MKFENYPKSVSFEVVDDVPQTVAELQDFVRAQERRGKSVRASGRGWSFNDALLTASGTNLSFHQGQVLGFAQGLWQWGGVLGGDALRPEELLKGTPVVHVQAGIRIRDLCYRLDGRDPADSESNDFPSPDPLGRRWAIPNLGGAAGQTLAGVLSTSTSGGNFHYGPIASLVRALRLVGPGGRDHWIEPSKGRITVRPELRAVLGADANLHYDTDLFRAALTAVGAFGVLAEVILEVVPQFGLKQYTTWSTWTAVRGFLTSLPLGSVAAPPSVVEGAPVPDPVSERLEAFEVLLNPYRRSGDYSKTPSDDDEKWCLFVSRTKRDDGIIEDVVEKPEPPFPLPPNS